MTNTSLRGSGPLRSGLAGAWSLEAWQTIDTNGAVTYPLGEDAVGELTYDDESGTMSAQLVAADQARFASDDWQQASPDEMVAAWPRYFGYFGTFTVDESTRTVTHHIRSGWFPNLAGTEQVRHCHLDEDRLTLEAETAWGSVRIVWRRCPAAG